MTTRQSGRFLQDEEGLHYHAQTYVHHITSE
jgi:hypothetical protein